MICPFHTASYRCSKYKATCSVYSPAIDRDAKPKPFRSDKKRTKKRWINPLASYLKSPTPRQIDLEAELKTIRDNQSYIDPVWKAFLKALIIVHVALGSVRGEGLRAAPPAPQKPPISQPNACDRALNACQDVITAQDRAIINLKAHVTILEDRLAEASKPPTVPTWMLIAGGVLIGATAATLLHNK